jgi:pimeloyl-ACP methyl ester carboxylesterase
MARAARAVSSKAEPKHPSTEVIVVNGVPVTTRSAGSGDPLILLNRFRGTIDTWDPAFVAALASRHRVVMFNSLGIGETEATRRQRSKLLLISRPA